jgi:hypothetical protein
MAVVAGGSGAAGGRARLVRRLAVHSFILHWISWVSSTLALFLWLSWLAAAARLVAVSRLVRRLPFTLYILHWISRVWQFCFYGCRGWRRWRGWWLAAFSFTFPFCSISFVAKRTEKGPNGS